MHLLSLRPAPLNTGVTSRLRRAESALRAIGVNGPIDNLRATNQASASTCRVNGVQILISYVCVPAYMHDGVCYAAPADYYSATTERSVVAFAKGARIVRCASPDSLHASLKNLVN